MTTKMDAEKGDITASAVRSPWPFYDQETINRVSKVLKSGNVNQWGGTEVNLFAKEFASFHQYDTPLYAVPNCNGSTSLQLAMVALEVGPKDEVIVSPRSFIISATAPLLNGATPVFADVDRNGNLCEEAISKVISERTKAVILVHMGGLPCDMEGILRLCRKNNILVVEDCSQAHGAMYKNRYVGTLGDIGTWSFCRDKIMSTGGEGGICLTSNETLFRRMWAYKDHGRDYQLCMNTEIKWKPGYRRLCTGVGTNYRMTEIQATIGRYQLLQLHDWIGTRNKNAKIFLSYLADLKVVRLPEISANVTVHSYYRIYIFLCTDNLKSNCTNVDISEALRSHGVPSSVGSCATLWDEPCFDAGNKKTFKKPSECVIAKSLWRTQIAIECHNTLSQEYMHKIGEKSKKILLSFQTS